MCSKNALCATKYFPSNYITFALSVRCHGCKIVFQSTNSKYFHACRWMTDLLAKKLQTDHKSSIILILQWF